MQTIHEPSRSRLFFMRMLCGGLLASAMVMAQAEQRGWQIREFSRIELVAREASAQPNQHPADLPTEVLRAQLARVRFMGETKPLPLFASEELEELIGPLSQALDHAKPGDDIQLYSSSRRDGGLLTRPTAVTARVFVQDGQLQIIVHDTRFEFFDAYRGAHIVPRFVFGSRTAASTVVLSAAGATNVRADWLSIALPTAAPAAVVPPAAAPAPAVTTAIAPPAPAQNESIEQRLEVLKRLREKNLISEEEYQQKRKEILQSL
ncbi:MAG: SHOCT domain-containing protein [Rhizobacter sp.]